MSRPYGAFIDPGHGGRDPGAVNKSLGIKEKDINLNIGLLMRRCVIRGDYLYMPFITRDDDYYVSLQARCDKAKLYGVQAFLSIHCNARERKGKSGIELEIYHARGSKRGAQLAEIVLEHVFDATSKLIDCFNRGVKEKNFYVLAHTPMPAALIELGFITDDEEARFLNERKNQRTIAKALSEGVEYFLEGGSL